MGHGNCKNLIFRFLSDGGRLAKSQQLLPSQFHQRPSCGATLKPGNWDLESGIGNQNRKPETGNRKPETGNRTAQIKENKLFKYAKIIYHSFCLWKIRVLTRTLQNTFDNAYIKRIKLRLHYQVVEFAVVSRLMTSKGDGVN